MKLVIIAALCLLSLGAKAQVQTVQVTNNTSCTVYYVLQGNPNPGCGGGWSSNFIAQAPFSVITYDATSLSCGSCTPIALAAGDNLIGAQIWDNNWAACALPVATIGELCYTGGTTTTGPYNTLNNSGCATCATVNATWSPAGPGVANLDFN